MLFDQRAQHLGVDRRVVGTNGAPKHFENVASGSLASPFSVLATRVM
jgi:hypothetical protein